MPEVKLEQGQLLHVLIKDTKVKPAQIKFSLGVVVGAYDPFFVVSLRSVEGWMSFHYDQIVEDHSESPERMEVVILKIDGERAFSDMRDGHYTFTPILKTENLKPVIRDENASGIQQISQRLGGLHHTLTLVEPDRFEPVIEFRKPGYFKRLWMALMGVPDIRQIDAHLEER